MIHICDNCGKEYETSHKNSRFCSRKCMGENRIKRVNAICPVCGKAFETYGCKIKDGRGKYCSKKCADKFKATLTGCLAPRWEGGKTEKHCIMCGKTFFSNKYNENTHKFCSKECFAKYLKTLTGEKSCNYKGIAEWKTCEQCGSDFYSKHKGVRFCCRECADEFKVGKRSNKYNRVKMFCINCGREFEVPLYRANMDETKFCSSSCRAAYNYKKMPNAETGIEKTAEKALLNLEVPFEKQKSIGHYVIDFYIEKYNLCIECDGDYWHTKPGAKEKDERKNRFLEQNGYKLLRIWEHDINADAIGIISRYIDQIVKAS